MKWVDLSPYKPVSGAAVASTPIANGLQKVQDSLNSVGVAGAAIASAGTINITNPVHQITGVTAIATIADANVPTVGETVTLWIQTGLTIQNNGGGVGNIRTLSGSDRVCKANEIVVLLYDGAVWRETNPQAAAITYRKTTAKVVNTTVAATDLLNGEITLAAGDLGTTKALRATLEGDWLNNAGAPFAPPRIQVVVGGTIVLDTGAAAANNTINQGVARGGWTVEIFALELGATNSQLWRIKQTIALPQGVLTSDNGPFTTGEGSRLYSTAAGGNAIGFAQGFNTSALDMTTAKTFVINVINGSASASYETKLFGALVEIT